MDRTNFKSYRESLKSRFLKIIIIIIIIITLCLGLIIIHLFEKSVK